MPFEVVRTLDQLLPKKAAWEEFSPHGPFSTFDFVTDWFLQIPPGAEPFLLWVEDERGPLAIAPWCLQDRTLTGIWGEDAWFHDPLFREPLGAKALMEALLTLKREWGLLSLNLRERQSGPWLKELQRLHPLERRVGWSQHRLIAFEEGWEGYWNSRSASCRKKVRSLKRKLEGVPHQFLTADAENLGELMQALFRLHHAHLGWKRDWEPYYAMVRGMIYRAFERGELFLQALRMEERIVAATLQIAQGEAAYGILTGFDPAFAEYSVGTLLMLNLFEHSAQSGIRQIDSGGGEDEWKTRFSNVIEPTVRIEAASPASLSAQARIFWKRETEWRVEECWKPWLRERPALLNACRVLKH